MNFESRLDYDSEGVSESDESDYDNDGIIARMNFESCLDYDSEGVSESDESDYDNDDIIARMNFESRLDYDVNESENTCRVGRMTLKVKIWTEK